MGIVIKLNIFIRDLYLAGDFLFQVLLNHQSLLRLECAGDDILVLIQLLALGRIVKQLRGHVLAEEFQLAFPGLDLRLHVFGKLSNVVLKIARRDLPVADHGHDLSRARLGHLIRFQTRRFVQGLLRIRRTLQPFQTGHDLTVHLGYQVALREHMLHAQIIRHGVLVIPQALEVDIPHDKIDVGLLLCIHIVQVEITLILPNRLGVQFPVVQRVCVLPDFLAIDARPAGFLATNDA